MAIKLTLGPVLFNWSADKWRDFYFRIADEAPVDVVYVGEAVCSKRAPFFDSVMPLVLDRLEKAKKETVISSLAMVMNKREVQATRELVADPLLVVEANDVSALAKLNGKAHIIGPYINIYNEGTLSYLAKRGAKRFWLTPELPFQSLQFLAAEAKKSGAEIETQVFGRMPLALSARCYHARAYGLTKDNCQFVCNKDPGGMMLHTLDDQPFLAVNGIQTLSSTYLNLMPEMMALEKAGIEHQRLSPQDCDMVEVLKIYRDNADKNISPAESELWLQKLLPEIKFSNGYFYGSPGHVKLSASA